MITNQLDCRGRPVFNGDIFGGGWETLPGGTSLDWGQVVTGGCGGTCGCTVSALPLGEMLTVRAFTGEVVPLEANRTICNDTNGDGTGDPTWFYGNPEIQSNGVCNSDIGVIDCQSYQYTPSLYSPHLGLLYGGLPMIRVNYGQVSRFLTNSVQHPSIFAQIAPSSPAAYAGSDGFCCRLVYAVPTFGTYIGRSSPESNADILVNIPFHFSRGSVPFSGFSVSRPKLCCNFHPPTNPCCGPFNGSCDVIQVFPGGATYRSQDGTTDSVTVHGVTACAVLQVTVCSTGSYDLQFIYRARVLYETNFYRDPANPGVSNPGLYGGSGLKASYDVGWSLRAQGSVPPGTLSKPVLEAIPLGEPALGLNHLGVPIGARFNPQSFKLLSQPSSWSTSASTCFAFPGAEFGQCTLKGYDSLFPLTYQSAACTPVKVKLEL